MRKIKQVILMAMFLMLPFGANAEKYDLERLISAIAQVESKGKANAVNKKGDCVGILQITKTLVKECNDIMKKKGDKRRFTLQDRYSVEKSKEMFKVIQEYHNKEQDLEKGIRIWNGGYNGMKNPRTKQYYKKVIKEYRLLK